jgi:lipopolysaccharide/colanic/teichoic acid biosynthesis glycosyltransferase
MSAGVRGRAITASGDRRITQLGAILRRWKLDELPQLLNVLAGNMSLVGPRPEVPEYVDFQAPIWTAVLSVRPGLTDVATLLYRDEERLLSTASDPEAFYRNDVLPAKLLLSLRYIQTKSFQRDLRLILLTLRSSISGKVFDQDWILPSTTSGRTNV